MRFEHVIVDAHAPLCPHIKTVGDVNGDGHPDIVVASSKNGPLVWYQWPTWDRHVIAPSGTWSCDAALADMDGDGDLDLVISEWYTHNRLEWYENPLPEGNPATNPWKRHILGAPRAHDIRVGDVDGDGKLEIVTRSQGQAGEAILVWKRDESGVWSQRRIACPTGEGLALGDLAGNGRLHVVIGGRWYEAPKDIMRGSWAEHVFTDWSPDAKVALADINGDRHLDVVLTRSEGPHRLSWFASPEDPRQGAWTEHIIEDSVDFAHGLAVCDMNKDGRPDIVAAEMHQSPRRRVMVYLNQRDGLDWGRQVIATTGSHNLCVADFAGDGRPALVGANWSGEHQPVEVWRQCQADESASTPHPDDMGGNPVKQAR